MIIKSQFKDYYDWVANKYGGDPKIVYVRQRLVPRPEPGGSDHPLLVEVPSLNLTSPINFPGYWRGTGAWRDKQWMYLVIAGKLYLISKPLQNLSEDVNSYQLEPLIDPEDAKRPSWKRYRPRDIVFGQERADLIQLSRQVGHPVFAIKDIQHAWYGSPAEVIIAPQCPILQHIGLPALIPAEQMYQDLSYFVGNLIHKTPDTRPPVELSNTQKILKAGFDMVKSFRHRKQENQ